MKCPFCEKKIEPEIGNQCEAWGIIQKIQCPKCFMLIDVKLLPADSTKKHYFKSLKEILAEANIKDRKKRAGARAIFLFSLSVL